jgi:hypothetical protein
MRCALWRRRQRPKNLYSDLMNALPVLALPVHLRVEVAVIKDDRIGPRQTVRQ